MSQSHRSRICQRHTQRRAAARARAADRRVSTTLVMSSWSLSFHLIITLDLDIDINIPAPPLPPLYLPSLRISIVSHTLLFLLFQTYHLYFSAHARVVISSFFSPVGSSVFPLLSLTLFCLVSSFCSYSFLFLIISSFRLVYLLFYFVLTQHSTLHSYLIHMLTLS
jgi:hypothetical protein